MCLLFIATCLVAINACENLACSVLNQLQLISDPVTIIQTTLNLLKKTTVQTTSKIIQKQYEVKNYLYT